MAFPAKKNYNKWHQYNKWHSPLKNTTNGIPS